MVVQFNQKVISWILIVLAILLIIILGFTKIGFDNQAVYLCSATSLDPDVDMEDCPAHTSNTPWLLMIGFGISVVILATGLYLLFSNQANLSGTKNETAKTKSSLEELSEEEKTIYDAIVAKDGSIFQSTLVSSTGLSKVKVTRILDKLEYEDHLVERKRRGMTNIVILK